MTRKILASDKISTNAEKIISTYHQNIVEEVANSVANNKIVVVGMAQNPYVNKAKNALQNTGLEFKYLEYGNYFSQWKQRLAIKLWSGWATYPQVFVNGKLIGGFKELSEELATGSLKKTI